MAIADEDAAIAAFQADLGSRVLRDGDAGYDDARKVWTVEPRRMAIQHVRFCVFDEDIFMADGKGDKPTTWSAGATCLAEGKKSHDFLFFRVKDNLREMRVTFNDSSSVDLVRCPIKS